MRPSVTPPAVTNQCANKTEDQHFACLIVDPRGQRWILIFILRKKRSKTKKRMNEEEIAGKAIAGSQPEKSFFFWDFVGLEPSGTESPRRQESNALAGYTTGPSSDGQVVQMVRWCVRLTRLTLVCEVIRHRLVQVRQNLTKKGGYVTTVLRLASVAVFARLLKPRVIFHLNLDPLTPNALNSFFSLFQLSAI